MHEGNNYRVFIFSSLSTESCTKMRDERASLPRVRIAVIGSSRVGKSGNLKSHIALLFRSPRYKLALSAIKALFLLNKIYISHLTHTDLHVNLFFFFK